MRALLVVGLAACAPSGAGPAPPGAAAIVVDGWDWAVPPGVGWRPATGLYAEEDAPDLGVDVHVLDLTWAQLERVPGDLRRDAIGHAAGRDLGSWDDQRRDGGRYWLRLWMADAGWMPTWVVERCGASTLAEGCVAAAARALVARVLAAVDDDRDFVLAYVPVGDAGPRVIVEAPETVAWTHPAGDDDGLAALLRTDAWQALAGGASWLYVVPSDRYVHDDDAHRRWVRASLGRGAADAFDGWIAPQPGGDVARFVTRTGAGYAIDPAWLTGAHELDVAVTFVDGACGTWQLAIGDTAAPPVPCTGDGAVRTARLPLPAATAGAITITDPPDVRFLRVIRR